MHIYPSQQPTKLGAAERYIIAMSNVTELKERLEFLRLASTYEDSCTSIRYVYVHVYTSYI